MTLERKNVNDSTKHIFGVSNAKCLFLCKSMGLNIRKSPSIFLIKSKHKKKIELLKDSAHTGKNLKVKIERFKNFKIDLKTYNYRTSLMKKKNAK